MKHISKIVFLFSFAGFVYSGCASSTTPPPTPPNTTHVNYLTNANYTYTQNRRDTAGGTYGMDKTVPTKTDNITSTVFGTNMTYMLDTSDVAFIQNMHTASMTGSLMDSTYIAQENGNYWHFNYGLEGLSSVLSAPVGWVLQAKLGAKQGDTWVAVHNMSVATRYGINADVLINATEQADTSIVVNGTTITGVKHVTHAVIVSAPGVGQAVSGTIDTYVSPDFGMIRNVVHSMPLVISIPPYLNINQQLSGSETMMVSHP